MAATNRHLISEITGKARRHRLAGFFLAFLSFFLIFILIPGPDEPAAEGRMEPVIVQAKPRENPKKTGLEQSELTVEAAFVLRSPHRHFGGLSGLWLSDDAKRLVSVGDSGWIWQARLHHDDHGRLIDLDDWSAANLADQQGNLGTAPSYDAEALAADGGQDLVVAYEGQHRFRRLSFPELQDLPHPLPVPPGLGRPSNSGIEALTGLGDGRFLVMAEGVGARGGIGLAAWLIDHDRIDGLTYRPSPNYAPTGADRLGSMVYIVERRFSLLGGFQSQVLSVPVEQLVAGDIFEGQVLARFRYGDLGENFEAIAARQAPDGRTLIYLLSDDNFSVFQQTTLLQLSRSVSEKTRCDSPKGCKPLITN